jgi:hypothetical protein
MEPEIQACRRHPAEGFPGMIERTGVDADCAAGEAARMQEAATTRRPLEERTRQRS